VTAARRRVALGLVALLVAALPQTDAAAPALCGTALDVGSAQDAALLAFAAAAGVTYPQAFRSVANVVHATGRLPSCYLAKAEAEARGWRPGRDLWEVVPGAAIGGDPFGNRERQLPPRWNGRYVEADLDYDGGPRGGHRLVYIRGEAWPLFVTTDHYRSFASFEPAR
jgi:hypothetical protein